MCDYSHTIREVSFSPVDIMGNFFEAPFYAETQELPSTMSFLKTYFTSLSADQDGERKDVISWYANIDDVVDVSEESILIKSLTPTEKQKVKRFMFADDQKRALLSILLQRTLIRQTFNVKDEDYELCRTKEGKPLVVSRNKNLDFKTWNFNVSHHGKYVCIVAHSHLLMGADIVDLDTRSNMASSMRAMEFIEMFEAQLTDQEVRNIRRQPTERAKYSYFYIIWSLKEAFIKAIGQGLGYDLKEVEFDIRFEPGCDLVSMETRSAQHSISDLHHHHHHNINNSNNDSCSANNSNNISGNVPPVLKGYAIVSVKNKFRNDWRMDFVSLDYKHVMSVARGPLSAALPTFREKSGWSHHHLLPTFEAADAHDNGNNISGGSSSTSNGVGEHSVEFKKHHLRLSAPLPTFERKSIADIFPQL